MHVIFKESSNRLLSFFLKRGFQHCFVVLYQQGVYVTLDPDVDTINVSVDKSLDIPKGCRVVSVEKRYPEFTILGLHTCVSIVKRIIGLNKWWIITPYQLYKELESWECLANPDRKPL